MSRGEIRRLRHTGAMSSGSRRAAKRETGRSFQRPDLTVVPGQNQAYDCPGCAAGAADPEQMLTDLVDDAAGLAEVKDPLEAELAGAVFVAMAQSGDDTMAAFAGGVIPAIEASGARAALTLLTAIGAAADKVAEPVAESAQAAAARLTGGRVAVPSWADDLAQPLTAAAGNMA